MSEFKVGDRVITRWDDSLLWSRALARDTVPEGEHVIIEISLGDARLDKPDGFWYPLRFMTKIDDAPAAKDDGGPAFPRADVRDTAMGFQVITGWCPGMSLRDYFAAQSMQGDWAAQNEEGSYYTNSIDMEFLVKRAELYYRMADVMLEARKK